MINSELEFVMKAIRHSDEAIVLVAAGSAVEGEPLVHYPELPYRALKFGDAFPLTPPRTDFVVDGLS